MPYCSRPHGSCDTGTCCRNFSVTGLRREGSTRLSTKPPVRLSCRPPLHAGDVMAVKSQFSIAWVGTKLMVVAGLLFSTRPWEPADRNLLFLITVAPSLPPTWVRFRLAGAGA